MNFFFTSFCCSASIITTNIVVSFGKVGLLKLDLLFYLLSRGGPDEEGDYSREKGGGGGVRWESRI